MKFELWGSKLYNEDYLLLNYSYHFCMYTMNQSNIPSSGPNTNIILFKIYSFSDFSLSSPADLLTI